MQRRRIRIALVAALTLSGLVHAGVRAGQTLYIRARDTQVFQDTKAAKVVATLQVGDRVRWQAQAEENRKYHLVELPDGKRGYVWYQALSTTQPRTELSVGSSTRSGKNLDVEAFASTAAAARGLTEAAQKVSHQKDSGKSAKQLAALEQIAAGVSPKEIAAHRKRQGLTGGAR